MVDAAITRDRSRGAFVGLACGDALGTTVEFKAPGTFTPITDLVGGGPFGLEPGEWTDDTSMALCLAESLIERGGFDPVDQLERYVRWWREGHLSSTGRCFDIGNQTSAALSAFERTGSPDTARSDEWSAGNGSIMRLAPVPIACAPDIESAIEYSGRSSMTTHPRAECVDACRYIGALIAAAIAGVPKDQLLAAGFWHWGELHPAVKEVGRGSYRDLDPPYIQGGRHVVRCLEAALWALHRSDSFEEGVLLAVNLGDDADTTGAVYGQLAGAIYGESTIPQRWREKLAMRELIVEYADRLAAVERFQA